MVNQDELYSVDQALESIGFGKFQYLVLLYAGLGWFSEAAEVMLLSYIGPVVQSEWNLTSEKESLITTVVFAGMLVGAYTCGIVSDRYGRRKGFLATAVVTFVSGLMSAASPNYISLIILRGMVGVGLGGAPVLLSWFLEFIPAPERGTWLVIFQAFFSAGAIAEAGLAWLVIPRLGWRMLVGLSSLPALLLLIFYAMVPESPRYLCLKGDKEGAFRILEKVAKLNKKELPRGALFTDHEIEHLNSLPLDGTLKSPGIFEGTATPSKWKDSDMGVFGSLPMLLSEKLARSTLLIWMLFFGNCFLYYGLVLLTAELNNSNTTCNPLQLKSEQAEAINYKNIFITSFAELPGLILAGFLVDRLGRKPSLMTTLSICCIFMLPLVVRQSEGLTTFLLFGARACMTAAFTLGFIYAPEIYPTSVRSTGVGVASSMGRIGGMVCPLVSISLVHRCHQTLVILLFLIVVLATGISVMLFPLETKGLGLTDSVHSNRYERPEDKVPLLA